MWTLLLISISAILWLLQFTLGQDSGMLGEDVAKALFLAAWGVTAIAAVQLLQYAFTHWLIGKRRTHAASDLLRAVVRILLYLVAGGLFLHFALGQAVTGILATSAMLTVIVGLALQPTLGHLFSGVSIEIERPLRVGDYIRRGDLEGQVTSLNWRSVFIRTERGSRVVMPNSDFTSHTLEVIGVDQPFRHSAFFDMSSAAAPGTVMRIAMRVLRSELPHVCRWPEPSVVMLGTEPRSGSVRYAAHFYTLNFLERNHVASAVLERLWYALSRGGLQLLPPPRFGNMGTNNNAQTAARPATTSNEAAKASAPALVTATAKTPEGNTTWKALLGDLLPGLAPALIDRLAATARRYRYGQYETVSPKIAAVVISGRLREACAIDETDLDGALQRVLQDGPKSVGQEPCLPRDTLNRLLTDSTLAIGPLAQSLVAGYAAVTDDLWLVYQAVATGIGDADQRAAFLARGPQQPSRGLTAGGMPGWVNVLNLAPMPIPCHATQDSELLIWNATTLRSVLGAAAEVDLESLLTVLGQRQPACKDLDLARLRAWLQAA